MKEMQKLFQQVYKITRRKTICYIQDSVIPVFKVDCPARVSQCIVKFISKFNGSYAPHQCFQFAKTNIRKAADDLGQSASK